jgi:ketosteroid isomerase-like protein
LHFGRETHAEQGKIMRAFRAATFLPLLVLCLVPCVFGQDTSEQAKVRTLESQWSDAYKQRDVKALASLLADDFIITMEDGSTYSKIGLVSYNTALLHVDVAEFSNLRIHIRDNIAVVTGAYHERGVSDGKSYEFRDRLTDVWMKIDGKWQLLASHYSVPSRL